jgi:hypothetical protein
MAALEAAIQGHITDTVHLLWMAGLDPAMT